MTKMPLAKHNDMIKAIYRRYLALKSVRDLHDELAGAGVRSKRRVQPDGTTYGGQKIARGALYLMLQNRIYRGEITFDNEIASRTNQALDDIWLLQAKDKSPGRESSASSFSRGSNDK
jgi:hypothetical protein